MILKNLSHRSCGLDDFRSAPSAYRDGFTSSYCCEVKYSEKQIGFSHGNSNNLHLISNTLLAKTWLSTGNRIFSSTAIDTTLMVQVLRLLEIEAKAVLYIQNSQTNLASAAGNPGWSLTRPKLVCWEAWWLRSNKSSSNGLYVVLLSCYLSS